MDEPHAENRQRKSPATVVNGTRVTVAFPFSKIVTEEPSDDLRDLAVLVADLVDAVADAVRPEVAEPLRHRAIEVRDRLVALSHT